MGESERVVGLLSGRAPVGREEGVGHRKNDSPGSDYLGATAGAPPWDTLVRALSIFEAEGRFGEGGLAIDLGCGSGRDTFELLKRGWRVLAIDVDPEAVALVQSHIPPGWRAQLETQVAAFEEVRLPRSDLVNAGYSLPYCSPQHFDSVWQHVVASLRSGGRFCGHFFGIRDGWSARLDMTFHTTEQVRAALSDLATEFFLEEEADGRTALGRDKRWHTFSVVARKP